MSERHPAQHYRWFTTLPTRWSDNDMFGHVNNAAYYVLLDTALGKLLAHGCDFDPLQSSYLNVVLKNQCQYFESLSYPDDVRIGVVVEKLGRSSVTYNLGLFRNDQPSPCAQASVVEVWLSKASQQPVAIPEAVRSFLHSLLLSAD